MLNYNDPFIESQKTHETKSWSPIIMYFYVFLWFGCRNLFRKKKKQHSLPFSWASLRDRDGRGGGLGGLQSAMDFPMGKWSAKTHGFHGVFLVCHGSLVMSPCFTSPNHEVYGLFYGYYFWWCPIFPSHGTVIKTPVCWQESFLRKTN